MFIFVSYGATSKLTKVLLHEIKKMGMLSGDTFETTFITVEEL